MFGDERTFEKMNIDLVRIYMYIDLRITFSVRQWTLHVTNTWVFHWKFLILANAYMFWHRILFWHEFYFWFIHPLGHIPRRCLVAPLAVFVPRHWFPGIELAGRVFHFSSKQFHATILSSIVKCFVSTLNVLIQSIFVCLLSYVRFIKIHLALLTFK